MRKVFSNANDVIHMFAQRTQNEGRSSNVFFYGNKIYSYGYHYLLAEFVDDNTIIINNRGYSSTTAKHIAAVTAGTRQYRQLFTINIDLKIVRNRILDNNEKLKAARKPEIYVTEIIGSFENLTAYLKEFKKVNELKSDDYKQIKKIYTAIKKDEGKYLEASKERGKKEAEKAKRKFELSLKEFFDYEVDRLYNTKIKEDFLRVSADGTKVETTQGIRIEIDDARNLYRLIKAGRDVKGERIGSYRVSSLNGHLIVGCHRINTKNMHEVGNKILIV